MSDAARPKGPPPSSAPDDDPGANTEMFHRFMDEEYGIPPKKRRPTGLLIGLALGVFVVALIAMLIVLFGMSSS